MISADRHNRNLCSIAYTNIQLTPCKASSPLKSLQRFASVNHWPSIKYPWFSRRYSNINFYNIYNIYTWGGSLTSLLLLLLQILQVFLAVSWPMPLGMALEAFIIRSRARFDLWLLLRAWGLIRNLSFSFAFRRRPTLSLFVLLLNHHHMSGV
jgi:hypothetical protein